MNEAIIIEGKLAGPTICILGGVHGNELPGILAIDDVKEKLQIERGKVVLIYGNPRAIELGVRQTEQNLNRMFRDDCSDEEKQSYEFSRANYIRGFLDEADFCLDLHASYSKETVPFAFTEENGFEVAGLLPVKYVCSNIDAFEKGGTDGYMYARGKVGVCVECGYLGDREAKAVALKSIEVCLRYLGMIGDEVVAGTKVRPELLKVSDLYINQSETFRLKESWGDFTRIPAGVVIGFDGDEPIMYEEEFAVLFARNVDEKGKEAFLLLKSLDRF